MNLNVKWKMSLKGQQEPMKKKNIKFADAVMGYWGLEKGFSTVYTYDEKDYRRIEGLEVKRPA